MSFSKGAATTPLASGKFWRQNLYCLNVDICLYYFLICFLVGVLESCLVWWLLQYGWVFVAVQQRVPWEEFAWLLQSLLPSSPLFHGCTFTWTKRCESLGQHTAKRWFKIGWEKVCSNFADLICLWFWCLMKGECRFDRTKEHLAASSSAVCKMLRNTVKSEWGIFLWKLLFSWLLLTSSKHHWSNVCSNGIFKISSYPMWGDWIGERITLQSPHTLRNLLFCNIRDK